MKANRETIVLVAVACAMTFTLSRHAGTVRPVIEKPDPAAAQEQVWTGNLAQVVPAASTVTVEPMSSASLVVPKSSLALPPMPRKPPNRVAAAQAARIQVASNTPMAVPSAARQADDHSLLHTLNPINHLPDLSGVSRPFAYAGETIAGWFRR